MEIDFDKTSYFYKTFNLTGLVLSDCNEGTGTSKTDKYKVVVASDCNDNIGENITNAGAIDTTQVTVARLSNNNEVKFNLPLTWDNTDELVKVTSDTTFNLGEEVLDMKAIFIIKASSNVVVAYDIFINTIPITNNLIFEKDLIICSRS